MSISPSHIAQIGIPVRDLARAKAFYGDLLGLPHLFDAPPGLAFFQCGETRLMLSESEAKAAGKAGVILYYTVADAAEAQAALAAAGAAFAEDARCIARIGDAEIREVWLAVSDDGVGNHVGLMSERPAASS
jgi:methylmalonyl-CoA/ethylmalonyl-CoA epimerase